MSVIASFESSGNLEKETFLSELERRLSNATTCISYASGQK
jgi:hypothetical protein